ncbi:NAD(P)-dependent alcohol dehydrogenase [Streptomyces aidingensis]|uniref:NADPH:quinone reductase n=1 Tax=Streptomyces aidingensis TaxID=910347 RepID=A0A1I1NBP7_9ACTN|nr:NAD(P)-dependent alcohol dehydrogenase [Streptomyces aidingensis]SFC92193.1 NADPH:quinone reductase [Streptomyces aidingensis]
MKAVVQRRYGSPEELELREIERPSPGANEVLVRVRAASVHPDVWHTVTGRPYVLRLMGSGLRRPKQPVPGTDLAGEVVAVGTGVSRFRPGDEVFGETVRGHQWSNGGSFAEYAVAAESTLALKPAAAGFAQAAALPTSALIALQNFPPACRRPQARVLVNGAAGGVGGCAVQLATSYGAHVTGVDLADKLDVVRALGADQVLDGEAEDFTRGDARYDLVFDVLGNRPFAACRRVLDPGGRYVLIGHDRFGQAAGRVLGSLPRFLALMARAPFRPELRGGAERRDQRKMMAEVARLLESGRLAPVLDRTYPLEEYGAALRRLTEGRAQGRIVLTM